MSDSLSRLAARCPGRRVLITGAASGLGLELAHRFIGAGWRVGMLDVDRDRLEARVAELDDGDGAAMPLVADVEDWTRLQAAVDDFAADAGGLDALINNAGVALGGWFEEIPRRDWEWILGINLMGTVHGCLAALPHLRESGGLIANIASAAAFISSPQMSGYNASKAAVVSLSETLYGELLDSDADVCVAMPAFFRTNLLDRLRATPDARETARLLMKGSGLTVQRAADDVLRGMAERELYILVPSKLKLVWRFKRLVPALFARRFKLLREKRLAEMKAAGSS